MLTLGLDVFREPLRLFRVIWETSLTAHRLEARLPAQRVEEWVDSQYRHIWATLGQPKAHRTIPG